ncbi:uncharacterized protein LOC126833900 [Adelges cooleyi]|uniref:uncharacterized protein LOC126833900 n=1 Tax=Adelges cooleyi TaxID=133065 RepID=UPI00218052DF|nr:uncharacterized protein LOC126833900 [Adelges cooleyi]
MKFLYVITMSIALVNVLVADRYYQEVVKTNEHIKIVGVQLWVVIRFLICLGRYTFEEMVIMLTVPELAVRNSLRDINCQIDMRTEIKGLVGIRAPLINKDNFDWSVDLSFYGNKRREITLRAIKHLIRGQQRGEIAEFKNFSHTCYLIALFRSAKFPDSYVTSVNVDTDENCCIETINMTKTVYKSFGGIIWQMGENKSPKEPIADQF